MAVSKIAVVALVAIMAVPILLGYALNLSETTVTDYKTDGDSVNVTPLLQTSTGNNSVEASVVQLNTNFKFGDGGYSAYPAYQSSGTISTAIPMKVQTYSLAAGASLYWKFDNWDNMVYIYFGHGTNVTFMELPPNGDQSTPVVTINRTLSFHYNRLSGTPTGTYQYTSNGMGYNELHPNDLTDYMFFRNDGASAVTVFINTIPASNGTDYVNPAAGFRFYGTDANYQNLWSITMPDYTTRAILTVNLDSITEPSYSVTINGTYVLEKTTVGSDVSWNVHLRGAPTQRIDLYYNPAISKNTYQIVFERSEYPEYNPNWALPYRFEANTEFRYIGNWPSLIGEANYYHSYSFGPTYSASYYDDPGLGSITLKETTSERTPIIRMDGARFKGFEYPIISNAVYNPLDFRQNPSTVIKDTILYGDSITFGGNTYTVSKGNITIGTHQIALDGLEFRSIPADLGGFDNYIGNTYISNTAYPSTITFNGNWSTSITTTAQTSYTYNKTEWNVGEFAWDGIDQNFLIVGLITCLGVFIALGIYARKSRSGGIIPLMIVTGCAAMVFFIML